MDQSSAVILARVSSKSQEDEGYSLDSQLKLLSGYCESKGLKVIKVFKIAETASKDQNRKIFQELLLFISRNKIYHVAVEKTDRLTRNFRDAVAIDDWLAKDPNRRLHAVKENLLLHKEARSDVKFMWNIHLAVAKKYTDNLREEAMKGWAEKLAQGWLPAVPPPGYKTISSGGKRIHIPDEATKTLIQSLFKQYIEPNQSILTITEEMKAMGIRTRFGKPYSKSNVQLMLMNPFYIGTNRFMGKDFPGAQETIITKQLYEQVQQKMHSGKPSAYKKHNPVLKNVICCTNCGGVVTWQLHKGRYYGGCQRKTAACKKKPLLREDRVEEIVIDTLKRLVCPSEAIIDWVAATMKEQYQNDIEGNKKLSTSIQQQIDRIKRMDDGLYNDKLAGEITRERYQEKHDQLMTEKSELEKKLGQVDTASEKRLDQRLVLLELSQKAASLYAKKSPEQKRLIINTLFKSVTIKGGLVTITPTRFTETLTERVQLTINLMGATK